MSKPLYQGVEGRDVYSQSFADHMHAMTAEGLHDKADIAAELAYRDDRIRALEALLADAGCPNDCEDGTEAVQMPDTLDWEWRPCRWCYARAALDHKEHS